MENGNSISVVAEAIRARITNLVAFGVGTSLVQNVDSTTSFFVCPFWSSSIRPFVPSVRPRCPFGRASCLFVVVVLCLSVLAVRRRLVRPFSLPLYPLSARPVRSVRLVCEGHEEVRFVSVNQQQQ